MGRVQVAGYNPVRRGVVFERQVLRRYGPDHAWYVGACYGVRIQRHVPFPEVLIKGGGEANMLAMLVTDETSQSLRSWLKESADWNMLFMIPDRGDIPVVEGLVEGVGVEEHVVHSTDEETSQLLRSWLKESASKNMPTM